MSIFSSSSSFTLNVVLPERRDQLKRKVTRSESDFQSDRSFWRDKSIEIRFLNEEISSTRTKKIEFLPSADVSVSGGNFKSSELISPVERTFFSSSSPFSSSRIDCIDGFPIRLFKLEEKRDKYFDRTVRHVYRGKTTFDDVAGRIASCSDITESHVWGLCGEEKTQISSLFLRRTHRSTHIAHAFNQMSSRIFIDGLNKIFEKSHFRFVFSNL